jgi:DNA-binding transcriptional MerR regulator
MRMSELSDRSGVAVPTIKYYQRENLLHAGEFSSPTQASYDDTHVERLRLIRALIDIGGLSVASAREVITAIDDTSLPLTWTFGVAQRAISTTIAPVDSPTGGRGADDVAAALTDASVNIHSDNPGLPIAARVLDSYYELGHDELVGVLPDYLRAAMIVANADLDAVSRQAGRSDMAQTVVVGTVLGDSLLAGLRRIAQEHVSRQRFPAPEDIETYEKEES